MAIKRLSRRSGRASYVEPEQEPRLTERSNVVPELSKNERREVTKRARPSAVVVRDGARGGRARTAAFAFCPCHVSPGGWPFYGLLARYAGAALYVHPCSRLETAAQ